MVSLLTFQRVAKHAAKSYKELEKRLDRERELSIIQRKLQLKIELSVSNNGNRERGSRFSHLPYPRTQSHAECHNLFAHFQKTKEEERPERLQPATETCPPVYRWKNIRKR
jgi:hypothetical protein